MPQVPYNPVPQVGQTATATPSMHLNAPEEAFGGATAKAEQGLGEGFEKAGNELFARALAMQNLANSTEASEANNNFIMAAGKIHADFNSKEGKERADAYPQYQKDLQGLQQDLSGTLSNPMSRKLFDQESRSTMARTISAGATSAADGLKQWAHSVGTAHDEILTKRSYTNPQDQAAVDQAAAEISGGAAAQAHLMPGGYSKEREELLASKGVSSVYYHQVIGLAETDPKTAYDKLDDYRKRGLISGPEADTAFNKVKALTRTVGMDQIAEQVLTQYKLPEGGYSKSAQEMQAEVQDKAKELYKNDPAIGAAATSTFDRKFNQQTWAETQDARAVQSQLYTYMTKGVSDVKMLPDDLRVRMTPKQLERYPLEAYAYRRSEEIKTDKAQYDKVIGLYNNDNKAFMELNPMTIEGLSKGNIDSIKKLQREVAANGDPRVSSAITRLRASNGTVLQALDVYSRTKDNKDVYDQYTGALHQAIQSFQEVNGKPPNDQQLSKEILPAVLQDISHPGTFWGTNKIPFFKDALPADYKTELEKSLGRSLTDNETATALSDYQAKQFTSLFSRAKAAKPKVQDKLP